MSLVDQAITLHAQALDAVTRPELWEAIFSQRLKAMAGEDRREALGFTDDTIPSILATMIGHEIESADLFVASEEIAGLLWQAGKSLPPFDLRVELVPVGRGFIVLPVGQPYQQTDGPAALVAVSFSVLQEDDLVGLHVIPFGTAPGLSRVLPQGGIIWQFDHPVSDIISTPVDDVEGHVLPFVPQFVAAFFLFINQRLLLPSPCRPSRAWRRRASLTQAREPVVKVVVLRKADYVGGHAVHRDVDWAWRWLVRGHWRQQWMPRLQTHLPRWIAPYWKGPDDKPVKMPKATIFKVVR